MWPLRAAGTARMPKVNSARGNRLAGTCISRKLITGMAQTKSPSPPSIDAWVCAMEPQRDFGASKGQLEELPSGGVWPRNIGQVWLADGLEDAWRLEVLLEPGDSQTWVFRRIHDVRRARSRMISVSAIGVPYLKSEGVLLSKAKAQGPKDDADFRESVGLMMREAREWLREALLRVHPGHLWIAGLR